MLICYYVDSNITKADLKKIYNVGYEGEDFEAKEFLNEYSHTLVANSAWSLDCKTEINYQFPHKKSADTLQP